MIHWTPGITLESAEKEIIQQALKFYGRNKTQTADSLGIAIRTLDNKLEKYESDRVAEENRRAAATANHRGLLDAQRGGRPVQVETPRPIQNIQQPEAGVRVESAEEAGSQSPVPVPERSEVQEVLPSESSRRSTGKSRKGI